MKEMEKTYRYYFLISSIKNGGIHKKVYGFYKMLAKRFPYAIYYEIEKNNTVVVHAILDTRQNPNKIGNRLTKK